MPSKLWQTCWQRLATYRPISTLPSATLVDFRVLRLQEVRMSDGAVLRIGLQPRAWACPGRQPNIWRHLATSGDRPWPFPLFMILRMRRRIQEVPLLLNTKVAMDNTWQYFKAHSIFLERPCTYLQDFARKHPSCPCHWSLLLETPSPAHRILVLMSSRYSLCEGSSSEE